MRIVASLSVELPKRPEPPQEDPDQPLDPGLTRLIVIVVNHNTPDGNLTAYGLDPDQLDPDTDEPVFERCLAAGQLGTFLERIIDGTDPAAPYHGDIIRTLDTPVSTPPTGPKVQERVLRFAQAMRKDELVTQITSEAVSASAQNPSPPA
jgi:hypothetical protein